MKAGRVLGLPLPNVDFDEVINDKFITRSFNTLVEAFTSTLKVSVMGDVDCSILSDDIERLSGDAHWEIHTFLTFCDNMMPGPLHL